MFSFFRKKPPAPPAPQAPEPKAAPAATAAPAAPSAPASGPEGTAAAATAGVSEAASPASAPSPARSAGGLIGTALGQALPVPPAPAAPATTPEAAPESATAAKAPRAGWFSRLSAGLRKTGSSIGQVFTGARIDEDLYEELESALLMADTGVAATEWLLAEVRRKVQGTGASSPAQVRNILVDLLTQLLQPLEKSLVIGQQQPTVIMVAGVNGAGKTTSIGKLTKHLADAGASVLLAAADTFRAAAREQLAVWAERNTVEIVSQAGGDPAAVSFDAVSAGRARGKDVVLVDTAGRLPTQLHLMEELKKIKRTIAKAGEADARAAAGPSQGGTAPSGGSDTAPAGSVGASIPPHEVLLVIDGNTGQNALAQVKAFDAALGLTGLVVTKLDGTAKGGVLAAIAQWGQERAKAQPGTGPVPVYFIGVGEKLEDLETFNAREFALALLGQDAPAA